MKTNRSDSCDAPPPCMIFVDKDGTWFHKGAPIIHQGFLKLFYDSLSKNDDGEYIIEFNNQVCRLDVEDTPFVIVGVDFVLRPTEKEYVLLHLVDGTQEPLDPETLFIGSENVLYCRIRKGTFRARFSRPSYYQFANHVEAESDTDRFYVRLGEQKYYIDKAP